MEHELGPEIEIHGERPAWLDHNEGVAIRWESGEVWNHLDTPAHCVSGWEHSITAIRLRAGHPYYLATSKGFTYWPGGESAPDDWDGGPVLYAGGDVQGSGIAEDWSADDWRRTARISAVDSEIIGYRKRMEPQQQDAAPTRPNDELVERMIAFIKECADNCDEDAVAILSALNPDPMIQRARNICKDEFGVILPDDAPGMRAVLRGLREGGE